MATAPVPPLGISPEQFTEAINAGTKIAEAGLLDRMAAAYRLAFASIADDCARRFTAKATALTAAFEESEHPRHPAGNEQGGEFAPKGFLSLKGDPGSRKLSEKQVVARAQKVVDDMAAFYGAPSAEVRYEPEATGTWGTDARTLVAPTSGKQEIWFGFNVMDKGGDPEFGVAPFRQIAHEAAHATLSGVPEGPLPGFSQTVEEGGAEILSLNYWGQKAQPFDHRDAVRREGRWTDPGAESLAAHVVYRDDVKDVMKRAASAVGWDRDAIVAKVRDVYGSDHYGRLNFRDSTDPNFPPPEGVADDAEAMIRWLVDRPVTAAYVEAQHPRDPGGEGGGQWIAKARAAEDVARVEGEQRREQEAERELKLVEQTPGPRLVESGEMRGFPRGVYDPEGPVKFTPVRPEVKDNGAFWKAIIDADTGQEKAFWFVDPGGYPHHADMEQALYDENPEAGFFVPDYASGYGRSGYVSGLRPGPEAAAITDAIYRDHRRDIRDIEDTIAERVIDAYGMTAAFAGADPDEIVPRDKLAAEIERRTKAIREKAVQVTIGPTLHSVGVSFEPGGIFSRRILAQVGARIPDAEKSARDAVRTVIERAQREGWDVPQTAAAIKQKIVGLSPGTATQLARTDLIGTANASAISAARIVFRGEAVNKRWLATEDERTRPTHVEADGQVVPLEGKFTVGVSQMDYPGDPSGPDDEVCNCRCTLLFEEGVAAERPTGEQAFGQLVNNLDTVQKQDVVDGVYQQLRWNPRLTKADEPLQILDDVVELGPSSFLPTGQIDALKVLLVAGLKVARIVIGESIGLGAELVPLAVSQKGEVKIGLQQPLELDRPTHLAELYSKLVLGEHPGQDPSERANEALSGLIDSIAHAARRIGLPAAKTFRILHSGAVIAIGAAKGATTSLQQVKAREVVREATQVVQQVADLDQRIASRLVVQSLAAAMTAAYVETEHPRAPSGSDKGGEWVAKSGVTTGPTLKARVEGIEELAKQLDAQRIREDEAHVAARERAEKLYGKGWTGPPLVTQPGIIDSVTWNWDDEGAEVYPSWVKKLADNHHMTVAEYQAAVAGRMKEWLDPAYVGIRVEGDLLDEIVQDGRLKSQFESGRSGGTFNTNLRAGAEHELFGYPDDLPPEQRPIYGYVHIPGDSPGMVNGYGDVELELKRDVRSRATFTGDDSLGMDYIPAPINNPDVHAIGAPVEAVGEDLLKQSEFLAPSSYYTEAQVHGGVTLDDIAAVHLPSWAQGASEDDLRSEDIDPAALDALRKRGIPVEYDADKP